jgi:hypothetical protein
MLLEKNGKASSSRRTKHINIRYFFITDRIGKGEVSLKWCPTGDMTGDYASKPLQGALFKDFRDQMMGVVPAKDPGLGKTPKTKTPEGGAKVGPSTKTDEAPQECVGRKARVRGNNAVRGTTNDVRTKYDQDVQRTDEQMIPTVNSSTSNERLIRGDG